jgi:hypothetical protein
MLHLLEVQDFLQKAGRGELDSSRLDDLIEQFGEDCKAAIKKQFSRNSGYSIRMSGLGRPLCQQTLEKQGMTQDVAYNDVMRFLIGDLIEAAAMLIMKGAGITVASEQESCSLELAGTTINGTLDLVIEDDEGQKVWDVKSTSPWSFENKFSGRGGYDAIKSDDPFGYIMQGYLYANSKDLPFGGWIAINKSTGEWDFVEAPDEQQEDREEYMKEAVRRIEHLTSDADFKVPFQSLPETYTLKGEKIETGNRLMPKTCTFCSFKEHCWKNAELHPKVTSKAKFPPMTWYTSIKVREM